MNGVLLFAFNNEIIDYVKLASYAAHLIRKHLQYPVTLITDVPPSKPNHFDSVLLFDQAFPSNLRDYPGFTRKADFKNYARVYADLLTPYNRTLVLDVDYLVLTDALQVPMESKEPFLAPSRISDFSGAKITDALARISENGLETYWATAMVFSRGQYATETFNVMRHVSQHWQYFSRLYRLTSPQYRNDFALTIAFDHMRGMSGHVHYPEMDTYNFALAEEVTVQGDHALVQHEGHTYTLSRDIHVANKAELCRSVGALRG